MKRVKEQDLVSRLRGLLHNLLTDEDLGLVLESVQSRTRGAPRKVTRLRDRCIADHVALLRVLGWKYESAIASAEGAFEVKRTTVTNALRKHAADAAALQAEMEQLDRILPGFLRDTDAELTRR